MLVLSTPFKMSREMKNGKWNRMPLEIVFTPCKLIHICTITLHDKCKHPLRRTYPMINLSDQDQWTQNQPNVCNQSTNQLFLACNIPCGIVENTVLNDDARLNIPFKCLFMRAWTSSHLHELMSALYTFSFSLPTSRTMPAGPRAVPKIWFSSCRCPARWVGAHAPVSANNKRPPLLPQIKTRLTVSNVK